MKAQHSRLTYQKLLYSLLCILLSLSIFSQKVVLVLDNKGETLVGVEGYNHDFSFASITDKEGRMDIPELFQNEILTFKYLGFETISIDLSLLEKNLIELILKPKNEILEEVVLVGRNDIRSEDFLQKIDAVQSKDIASSNPQTSVDALSRYADVYVQKSQMGGGSPIIRGFEANKVLLVVDGVRLNNAIYRNGHLQNAITIDNAILDQMEVIYGPSSLMYGSDALGGVVHFRTKDPMLNLKKDQSLNVFGNYYARYGSANNEKSVHADINIGLKKWGSLTSISYSDYGDLRMGANRTNEYPNFAKRSTYQSRINNEDVIVRNERENLQVGTAYNQFDLLQKIRYQINDQMNITGNFQYSTSSDIPRYDQLVLQNDDEFIFAEWYYGPQKRSLASLKYKWSEEKSWMNEMIIIASRQDIEESRFERVFHSELKGTGIESVGVNALTLDISKKFKRKRTHMFYYGADANYNIVNSIAYQENINSGERNEEIFTRYPSAGSSMNILGAYAQYVNESENSNVVFHGGLRWSSYTTKVKYLATDPIQWPAYFYDGISSTNNSVSWSAGVNWKPTTNWTIRLLSATAFRAPNVDDIGKLRVNNGNALVPNTALGAERSINTEVNINRNLGRGSLIAGSFFYTKLSDAIVRQDFMLPDGSTTFSDGNNIYHVEGNVNAENAALYGVSLNLKMRILRGLNLSSSISYVKGEILGDVNEPLSHIPPVYGKTQLKYERTAWNFTILSQYNGKKPIALFGGSSDNPEYATPEGALAWAVFNFYTDYSRGNYTFQFGVENIFDKHYTPFASGVSGAGVNVIFAVRGKF